MELITYQCLTLNYLLILNLEFVKKYAKATKDQLIFEDYIFNIIKKQSTK